MDRTYWYKQVPEQPLFPDLLWSRPENKRQAGKLLIIGGSEHGFAAPAEAYQASLKAGVGESRVLLPDKLKKIVGKAFEAGEYAPSTPSGSFSQTALAEMLTTAEWADGVLLAGDFGKNSETAILLEKLTDKYTGQLTLTGDGIDYFATNPINLLDRQNTTLVLNFAQLQKIVTYSKTALAFKSTMDLLNLVGALHEFSQSFAATIVLGHDDNIFVAVDGQVSTTKDGQVSLVSVTAAVAVWWLQNPTKPFEALTTSIFTSLGANSPQ